MNTVSIIQVVLIVSLIISGVITIFFIANKDAQFTVKATSAMCVCHDGVYSGILCPSNIKQLRCN